MSVKAYSQIKSFAASESYRQHPACASLSSYKSANKLYKPTNASTSTATTPPTKAQKNSAARTKAETTFPQGTYLLNSFSNNHRCRQCLHWEKSKCQLGYTVKGNSKPCSQGTFRTRQKP